MISWTGLGWIGVVVHLICVVGAKIASLKFPEFKLASYAAGWGVLVVFCLLCGLTLRRFFPLPPHKTPYGKETISHQCCTVELEWAGLYALPFFAMCYFFL